MLLRSDPLPFSRRLHAQLVPVFFLRREHFSPFGLRKVCFFPFRECCSCVSSLGVREILCCFLGVFFYCTASLLSIRGANSTLRLTIPSGMRCSLLYGVRGGLCEGCACTSSGALSAQNLPFSLRMKLHQVRAFFLSYLLSPSFPEIFSSTW